MRRLAAPACTLEPLRREHAAEMFELLSDPAIYEFENAPPRSLAWLEARYARLERRASADGRQQWLNWVLRLPDGTLAGYVQATVLPGGTALVAYELASRHWGRGLGSGSVAAMLDELRTQYAVTRFVAVLKQANHRSLKLLQRLGFQPATADEAGLHLDPDERVMLRDAA
jgi:[ribosomal protein S5]-alanine N-acetyltransferase